VRDVAASIPLLNLGSVYGIYLANVGRQENIVFVGGKWNGSRHLVFWSLGTLTGLRDWVRGLVA